MELSTPKSHASEDWLAVYIGLFIFALSLLRFTGIDIFGWAITAKGLDAGLIAYSIGLGIVLLGILIFVSYEFFPAA